MSIKDGPGEGTWSVFASQVVEERDALREQLSEAKKRESALTTQFVDTIARQQAQHDAREAALRENNTALIEASEAALLLLRFAAGPHEDGGVIKLLNDAITKAKGSPV